MSKHVYTGPKHRRPWSGETFSTDLLKANQQPTGRRRK